MADVEENDIITKKVVMRKTDLIKSFGSLTKKPRDVCFKKHY